MKNPLRKRLLRELRSDLGKYIVIFLLMILSIGEVSGFLVADSSMIKAYNESFEKYNVEDGNFTTADPANKAQIKAISQYGVKIYNNNYKDLKLDNGNTLRIFRIREQVNRACLMEGTLPTKAGEIAVDRMYADNNHLRPGDKITAGKRAYKITGLVALSDYSALFENNSDTMFDSIKFGVSIVTPDEFSGFDEKKLTFCYSWKYDTPPATNEEAKDMAEDLMEHLNDEVKLESFIPRYENQAITFTGEDMGSDQVMMTIFLYIVILIIAFVFGVTINNTIAREAEVIGTLRASGYTRSELVRHYMAMPLIVTLISALVGNILGYTVLKNFNAGLYYHSYSLPTYVTIWNSQAFLKTTVIPLVLMLLITWGSLRRSLRLPPLRFLRRDLRKNGKGKAFPLSPRLPFFSRFRIRVILQNMGSYGVLFFGIFFANLLLMFGLLFPAILHHYQNTISENMLCPYQYILQVPVSAMNKNRKFESLINMMMFSQDVETDYDGAEKFTAYTLDTADPDRKAEEIMLYGIKDDSDYIRIRFPHSEENADTEPEAVTPDDSPVSCVFISSAFADKYGYKTGDTFTLKEQYETDTYSFRVEGIYHYDSGLTLFMDQKEMNRLFDLDSDYFSGYFSDREITDIDKKYIGSVIDTESMTKISRQLITSMGTMMYLVDVFSVIIFMILIYLLTKVIIEKNGGSISMAKILGYSNREISTLYIMPTSILVVLFMLGTMVLSRYIMEWILRLAFSLEITGWIPFYMDPKVYLEMIAIGLVTYAVVAFIEYRKIKKVPLQEALKNTE